MRIASSTMALTSQHELTVSYARTETFRMWKNAPQNRSGALQTGPQKDWLQISDQALTAYKMENEGNPQDGLLTDEEQQKIRLLEKILSAILGKKVKLEIPAQLNIRPNPTGGIKMNIVAPQLRTNANPGWGLIYESQEIYRESEMMSFRAEGVIRTADGREISFTTQLQLTRQYISDKQIDIKAGDALKDPLVINFGGVSAMLSTNKVDFDLDADGEKDQISFVNSGSGFLAIDQNDNGLIDDGTELFGPATGDGFLELAEYDEDHNGWIDENDPVYGKLLIWTYDGETSQLTTLQQKNVGAISVASIDTEFQYKNSQNQLEGLTRSTAVFLREDGGVGTVQQVDFVV